MMVFDLNDLSKGVDYLAQVLADSFPGFDEDYVPLDIFLKEDSEDKQIYDVLIPGVAKEDIGISYKNIEGQKPYLLLEVKKDSDYVDSFSHKIFLPARADKEKVTSVYKDGVFTLTIGKTPLTKEEKDIPIN